jgi:hypothetical protein
MSAAPNTVIGMFESAASICDQLVKGLTTPRRCGPLPEAV